MGGNKHGKLGTSGKEERDHKKGGSSGRGWGEEPKRSIGMAKKCVQPFPAYGKTQMNFLVNPIIIGGKI